MKLGNQLLDLRKSKHLSQEELAEKLDVTRQTISKWETDQSIPELDKIIPLCELYGITPNELLMGSGESIETIENRMSPSTEEIAKRNKRAKGISIGILLYFVAIVWVMIAIPVFMMNPIVASAIFLLICGIASCFIVYVCIMYKKNKTIKEIKEDKVRRQIGEIVAIMTTIIYLVISFATMAWHITWIIWVVYGLFEEILKLIFMLRGDDNEE